MKNISSKQLLQMSFWVLLSAITQAFSLTSFSVPSGIKREISAFRRLDDGYIIILITMDRKPLSNLGNGYQMMHVFDFLLNYFANRSNDSGIYGGSWLSVGV